MSKNIVLQNGTNYSYTLNNVSKLRTDLQNGGTCDWVPEDETLKHLTSEDEGKVVQNSALVSQTSLTVNANNTYDTTTKNSVVVAVPNTYSSSDEGKVIQNGALVSQTSLTINTNNIYDTTTKNSVVVAVPNTYSSSDEGKVIQNGALVSQTSLNINTNNIYDTTTKNSVVVAVPNTYSSSDEGKIVKSGALVALNLQNKNVTQNGTVTPDSGYDGLNSVTVEVKTMSCLVLDFGTISSLPTTVSYERITEDMVVVQAELGNPCAQSEDWAATTANGSVTVTGTLNGSTTLKLYLLEGED